VIVTEFFDQLNTLLNRYVVAFQKSLKENMNMSANHIELRNDTQRYENQLYRTTPKEYKVDDVKTTPKRARTSVQISTVSKLIRIFM